MNYRFTSVFDVSGPKSFRLASRKVFGEYGGNEQNLPESIRSFLIADEGKKICQIDQSGAEALVVANLAGEGNYKQLFEVGIKPHTYLALNIFIDKFRCGKPRGYYQFLRPIELSLLPEWPILNIAIQNATVEYQLGKKVAHAKAYGMGPRTFRINTLQESQGTIALTYQEAKTFLDMYGKLFPEVIAWQEKLINQVSNDRVLHNLFGYPRNFFGRWSSDLQREALSFIPQSTVGCLTSLAFMELEQYGASRDWDALINVHDAVVGQCPEDDVTKFCQFVANSLARELRCPNGSSFRMKSEATAGDNWNKKEMRKVVL